MELALFVAIVILFLIIIRFTTYDFLHPSQAVYINMDEKFTNIINGLLFFKTKVTLENVIETLRPVLNLKESTSRVHIPVFGWPYLVKVENFKLEDVVHYITLQGETLEQCLSRIVPKPLDISKPLWEVYIIDAHEEGSVVLVRIHHSMCDGAVTTQLLLGLSKYTTPPKEFIQNIHPKKRPSPLSIVRHLPKDLIKVFLQKRDPETVLLSQGVSGQANVSFCKEPFDLHDIKRVARTYGVSCNDVLTSMMSGSVRQYLLSHGEEKLKDINAVMWVNTRGINWLKIKPDIPERLSVDIGTVFIPIPITEDQPVKRLQKVHKITTSLLQTAEVVISKWSFFLIGLIPRIIAKRIWDALAYKTTLSISNVPGPQYEIEFAGEVVDKMMFFIPPAGKMGTFICIMSYNGKVMVGCVTCKNLVPDPEEIVYGFNTEFERLSKHL
jgi:diacylglycerol O-acyltransferase